MENVKHIRDEIVVTIFKRVTAEEYKFYNKYSRGIWQPAASVNDMLLISTPKVVNINPISANSTDKVAIDMDVRLGGVPSSSKIQNINKIEFDQKYYKDLLYCPLIDHNYSYIATTFWPSDGVELSGAGISTATISNAINCVSSSSITIIDPNRLYFHYPYVGKKYDENTALRMVPHFAYKDVVVIKQVVETKVDDLFAGDEQTHYKTLYTGFVDSVEFSLDMVSKNTTIILELLTNNTKLDYNRIITGSGVATKDPIADSTPIEVFAYPNLGTYKRDKDGKTEANYISDLTKNILIDALTDIKDCRDIITQKNTLLNTSIKREPTQTQQIQFGTYPHIELVKDTQKISGVESDIIRIIMNSPYHLMVKDGKLDLTSFAELREFVSKSIPSLFSNIESLHQKDDKASELLVNMWSIYNQYYSFDKFVDGGNETYLSVALRKAYVNNGYKPTQVNISLPNYGDGMQYTKVDITDYSSAVKAKCTSLSFSEIFGSPNIKKWVEDQRKYFIFNKVIEDIFNSRYRANPEDYAAISDSYANFLRVSTSLKNKKLDEQIRQDKRSLEKMVSDPTVSDDLKARIGEIQKQQTKKWNFVFDVLAPIRIAARAVGEFQASLENSTQIAPKQVQDIEWAFGAEKGYQDISKSPKAQSLVTDINTKFKEITSLKTSDYVGLSTAKKDPYDSEYDELFNLFIQLDAVIATLKAAPKYAIRKTNSADNEKYSSTHQAYRNNLIINKQNYYKLNLGVDEVHPTLEAYVSDKNIVIYKSNCMYELDGKKIRPQIVAMIDNIGKEALPVEIRNIDIFRCTYETASSFINKILGWINFIQYTDEYGILHVESAFTKKVSSAISLETQITNIRSTNEARSIYNSSQVNGSWGVGQIGNAQQMGIFATCFNFALRYIYGERPAPNYSYPSSDMKVLNALAVKLLRINGNPKKATVNLVKADPPSLAALYFLRDIYSIYKLKQFTINYNAGSATTSTYTLENGLSPLVCKDSSLLAFKEGQIRGLSATGEDAAKNKEIAKNWLNEIFKMELTSTTVDNYVFDGIYWEPF